MEVKNEIYRYMKELVAIPSISNSREEQAAGEYIREELGRQPYFQAHPELTGMYGLEGDFLSRGTPYGLVKGSTSRTVILPDIMMWWIRRNMGTSSPMRMMWKRGNWRRERNWRP